MDDLPQLSMPSNLLGASTSPDGDALMGGLGGFLAPITTVASGIMGMLGIAGNNSAQAALQQNAENYNTEMSDTSYQRGMADMKAAGLNPMLAYMQGGDSAPTAPMYQPSSPLAPLADSVQTAGDQITRMPKTLAENQEAIANANSAATAADQATKVEPSIVSSSASQAQTNYFNSLKAQSDASIADVNAAVAQAGKQANVNVAPIKPYVDIGKNIVTGVSSALDAAGIWKGLKYLGNSRYNPKTTGTFNLNTGEIHQ